MRPETPHDPPRQFITHDGERLAYSDEGDLSAAPERTVVAVPGLPGSVRDFRWLAPALPSNIRLIRIEPSGFGQSTRRGYVGRRVSERAAAVLAVMDALSLSRAHLLSHSAGALVIAHLASHHQDRAQSCALVASPGPSAHYPIQVYRQLARFFRSPWTRPAMHWSQRLLYRAIGFSSALTDQERMYTTLDAAAHDFPAYVADLQSMRQPVLMAWARDDRLIPPHLSEALAPLCPQGPRLCFEVGGHNIQKTCAVEIADALERFWVSAAVCS